MPSFTYIATGSQGDSVRGTLTASDKGDLTRKLKEKGLYLVSCRMDDDAGGSVAAPPRAIPRALPEARPSYNSSSSNGTAEAAPTFVERINHALHNKARVDPRVRPKGKVALKELVVFTRQISISINAGMSFVDALQTMSANTRNPLLSWILRNILDDILSGKKFSEALAVHPDVFKPVYISISAAGEAGGFMPEALNRIAEFLEKEIELRSKIKSAMVYPMVIASVASVVVIGMMVFIVPTFVKVFKDMGAPLPLPTRMLITISAFTRHGGFLFPFVFVALFLYARRLRTRNERFRSFWDEKMLALPLFGKLATLEIITRFIRTLASLVGNGVMALQAISVARQVVENRSIERVVDDIFSSVQQGNGISPVLYRSKYFPVLVANMVSTGEKTGAIPEVLTKMADYYDAEVSSAIRDLLTLMEPLMIVVMAVIVGFVIAGLMLPTFEMSNLVN